VPDSLPLGAESRLAFLSTSARLLVFTSPCLHSDALLFDAAANQVLRTFKLPAPPASLSPSPCGSLIAFGLADGGVMLVDAQQGEVSSAVLTGHVRSVRTLAFACGGAVLVSAAGDLLMLWRRFGLMQS